MACRSLALTALVLVASTAGAEEAYRYARIRSVERGVTLQRATESGAEEALPNLPFLPGDRVWTDESGRTEIQFAEGSRLRVDVRSKLDYVDHEGDRDRERIVLRLWSGSLYVHTRGVRHPADFVLETPEGVFQMREGGVYRVDAGLDETRLSVYEGEAALESGRRIRVRAGERIWARAGEGWEGPDRFDRLEGDEFAQWDADREGDIGSADNQRDDLPEEVSPYAGELGAYGQWVYQGDLGHVWRPYVDGGWRPYMNGYWAWTAYGWTWVPNEPWGWAPFHYGSWGFSQPLGWYWMPGRVWSPAWVVWAVSPSYVGWCPRGHRGQPVLVHNRNRGQAVPRGSESASSPWTWVQRADIGRRDVARRRVEGTTPLAHGAQVIDPTGLRLSRDLSVADSRAVPRHIYSKPTIGDTVPELRSDPMTTIPRPVARTRYESEREREEERRRGVRQPFVQPMRSLGRGSPPPDAAASPEGVARERTRPEGGEADREVLRPLFRRLSRPRPDGDGQAPDPEARARPRDEGPSHQPGGPAATAPPRSSRDPDAGARQDRPNDGGRADRDRGRGDGSRAVRRPPKQNER